MDSIRRAIVKVGGGRGFIIEHRREVPPFNGKRFASDHLVITAAHCLPRFPPCHSASNSYERTYASLLGTLDAAKPGVRAECVFADPVADIAVLSHPDYQVYEDAGAYDVLTLIPGSPRSDCNTALMSGSTTLCGKPRKALSISSGGCFETGQKSAS
jgi:hypothetical protein